MSSAWVTVHWPTYPANFCPLLYGGEFSKYSSDFGETIDQSVKRAHGGIGFGKGSSEHLQNMLSGLDSMKGARQIGLDRGGKRGSGRRQKIPGLGANCAKLALQIDLSEFGEEHGHFR